MQLRLPRSQLTVDELTSHIQGFFTSDATLKSIVVSGEISEFKKHTSGHCYFTLLGEESRVACALFKQHAGFIPKWPDNGDSVLVEGSVGLYPQRGAYQIYARRLVPVGAGAIERSRLEVKERLEKEGLFAPELRRPLPPYPSKVALITSKTGAAVWDVIQVASRRYPVCDIVVIPTQVQGVEAPLEIVRALSRITAIPALDCVLLVRGGGGREDLVPFDDERVVRAVRSCPVPVVSGVGHDIDITLCDRAADLRASTPSAAAEVVFPDRLEIKRRLCKTQDRFGNSVRKQIISHRTQLTHVEFTITSWMKRHILSCKTLLGTIYKYLCLSATLIVNEAQKALAVKVASLDALSPLSVMARGFVACERDNKRILKARELSLGDCLEIRFSDGDVKATVDEVLLRKGK